MKNIYALEKWDYRNLGGRMGTERVDLIWTQYFSTVEYARQAAEKDYKKTDGREKIVWKTVNKNRNYRTNDLLSCAYNIYKVRVMK